MIDCEGISKELKRSRTSCLSRWKGCLLPILKTHELGLHQSLAWKKDVMMYLTDEEVESLEDDDYNQLVQDVCPGQTTHSLRDFISSIRAATVEGKTIKRKEPLHELASNCSIRLCSKTRMLQKKLDHACSIVKIYEDLKAAKNILN